MSSLMCYTDGSVEFVPGPEQVAFVDALFSDKARGIKEIAAKMTGINKQCFYQWWHHKEKGVAFRTWYSGKCDEYLKESESIANASLMKQVKKGKELKLFYEIIGKLRNPINERPVKVDQQLTVIVAQSSTGEQRQVTAIRTGADVREQVNT
jgi:hypothetical protein